MRIWRSRMNMTVKVASLLPIRSRIARDNLATAILSIDRNRWRLTISISALEPSRIVMSPPCLEANFPGVLIVGLDDHLDQVMADDIFFVEFNELDSFDSAHHAPGFDQSRFTA